MTYNTSLANYLPRPISGLVGKYARFRRILFVQLGLMFVSVFEVVDHVLHLLSTSWARVVEILVNILDMRAESVYFKSGKSTLITKMILFFFMNASNVCFEMFFQRKSISSTMWTIFIYPSMLSQVSRIIGCSYKFSTNVANFSDAFVITGPTRGPVPAMTAVDRSDVLSKTILLILLVECLSAYCAQ